MKLYLDTSVWNYLFADHLPDKQAVTTKFLESAEVIHQLYISRLVIDELELTTDLRKRQALLNAIAEVDPEIFELSRQIQDLSKLILEEQIVTRSSRADALHVAISITNHMDALVSWNLKDLVRLKTRRLVAAFCKIHGYKELDIVTPEEV